MANKRDERPGGDRRRDDRSAPSRPRSTRAEGFGKPAFSPKKSFGGPRRTARGADAGPNAGPRRPYDPDRPRSPRPVGGEKPPFRRDDRPDFRDKQPQARREPGDFTGKPRFGGAKPAGRPPFGGRPRRDERRPDEGRDFNDRKPYSARREGEKPRFSDDRPRDERPDRQGDTKPAYGQRPRFDRERPGSGRPVGDRRRFDEGEKPARRFDAKPPMGEKRFDRPRPDGPARFTPRPRPEGDAPRNPNSSKPLFKSRSRHDEPDGRTPNYDLERFKQNAPRRIQKRIEEEEGTRGDTIRLNRYIANAGVCSRRDADKLIESGEVTVNGKVMTEMGYQVKPGEVVKYGSRTLNPEKLIYVLLNKPKDFITTTDDPADRRTVMELVKAAGPQRIYPVGRLDRNTTGLLLLTNDGELADKLTHPSNEIRKIYQAELDKPISTEDFEKLQAGFELEDGPIKPDEAALVTPDAQVVGIEIHSGRNRIVRRMFEALGYEVTKLDRTVYASLDKKDLPRGNWRFLTEKEVIKLKYF